MSETINELSGGLNEVKDYMDTLSLTGEEREEVESVILGFVIEVERLEKQSDRLIKMCDALHRVLMEHRIAPPKPAKWTRETEV